MARVSVGKGDDETQASRPQVAAVNGLMMSKGRPNGSPLQLPIWFGSGYG